MPISFYTDIDAVPGRVDQVSPLIRRVVADNPGEFTFTGTGTYLVGRGEVAVLDPGPSDPAHVGAVLGALGSEERLTHVLVTHTHLDHSPGTALVKAELDVTSFGFGPHPRIPEPPERVVFGDPEADESSGGPTEGVDFDFVPDESLVHGDRLTGPGWTLEAVHTPGHTSNHLCYRLVEERALFTGDHVMGWSTTVVVPPDGSMPDYLASLRMLFEGDDVRFWPTHGPPVTDPSSHLRALLDHREERMGQILGALASGPRTIAEIVPLIYADVTKKLWRAAASSVFAHLLALVDQGLVTAGGTLSDRGAPVPRSTYWLSR